MDFSEALNVKVDEIERPPLAPVGHYVFQISKPVAFGEVGNGRFDTVDFALKASEARDDVDPDDLAAAGGINAVNLTHRFLINKGEDEDSEAQRKRTLYNIRNFLVRTLGLEEEGKTLKELLDEAHGQLLIAEVAHRADPKDAEIMYPEIKRTAPVE